MVTGIGLSWRANLEEDILPVDPSRVGGTVADAVADVPPVMARNSTMYRQPDISMEDSS
jgi:hypothetical protein